MKFWTPNGRVALVPPVLVARYEGYGWKRVEEVSQAPAAPLVKRGRRRKPAAN